MISDFLPRSVLTPHTRIKTTALLVGKTVQFQITRTVTTTTPPLEFGTVTYTLPSGETIDVALATLKQGWAKLRESKGSNSNGAAGEGDEEADARKREMVEAEEEAKIMDRGVWQSKGPVERRTEYSMPDDPAAFLAQYKGKPLDGESSDANTEVAHKIADILNFLLKRLSSLPRMAQPSALAC